MRYVEFIKPILREYRRDITARNYGDRLIRTLGNTPLSNIPDILDEPTQLIYSNIHPGRFNPGKVKVNILGHLITYDPTNVEQTTEILNKLKPEIIAAILGYIESVDTTPNKQYTEWLSRIWINGGGVVKLEDLNRNDLLGAFTIGKRRGIIKPEHADINKYKTWRDFENVIKTYDVGKLRNITAEGGGYGNSTVITSVPDVVIVVPHDLDASRRAAGGMGEGSADWCTKSENMFNHYTKQGPLYVLIPRKPQDPSERYQLHFPSGQFMDENDHPVDLSYLLIDKFPGAFQYFKNTEPEILDLVTFADDSTLKPILEKISQRVQELKWEILNDMEEVDEYYRDWQIENAIDMGYTDSNGDIDWERLYDDNSLNNYMSYSDEAYKFNRFADDLINDIKSPKIMRDLAREMEKDGVFAPIQDLSSVISFGIEQNLGPRSRREDHGLADAIRRYINIRPKTDNATGKVIWTVSSN